MSDRFLFKGKRTDWQELPKEKWWIEGDVSHHKTGKIFIKERFGSALASYEIIPETLSQYVGGKDRKRKMVCENDIVKELDKDGEEYLALVVYSDTFAGFMLEDNYGCLYHIDFNSEKMEVVGNVFDNPELLKENERELNL